MKAYERAVRFLSRRAHFRRELEVKLRRRNHPDDEVEETLERLERQGYLDDRETARQYARGRLERKPQGFLKLVSDLQRKGADPDLAREVAQEVLPEDDGELVREAARRWARRASDPEDGQALARHLERQGFSRGSIVRVVQDMDA